MSFSIRMDFESVGELFEQLGDKVEEATRPAAQAGSQVFYNQVKHNVAALGSVTGNLDRAIYQVYSHDHSGHGRATYHISWNHRVAPHGHLVEFGYVQRYAVYIGKDGKWHTAVRAQMRDQRPPSRRAPQSEKDAYYMTLPQPKQVAAKAFVRGAMSQAAQAEAAVADELMRRIG